MEDSKEIDTPIATTTKLDVDEPSSSVNQKLYRKIIGSLLYLTASRPDIVFSVGLCARFQANPKESHVNAVKRILRYVKSTIDLCLWYPKSSNFNLVGYVDTDYAGFLVDRKSTSALKESKRNAAAKGKKKVSDPVEVVEIKEMDPVLHDEEKAEEVEVVTQKAKKIKTSKKKSPSKTKSIEPSNFAKRTKFAMKS
ncbi:secreted RxLR effector protein 161-like [Nicotiana sylvestris]|uniref:secreted RxLR effector protein 161-like n=1 Tax=Nicotiana sylvestris TaxID=4096 RepID=UPI00388C6235